MYEGVCEGLCLCLCLCKSVSGRVAVGGTITERYITRKQIHLDACARLFAAI